MTPEAWQRIKAVFDAARQRPPSEWASFLDAACGGDASVRAEVESLLAADQTESLLDTTDSLTYARLRTTLADRYRLERELGRGGMATVYLAHDLKHDRPVALKVLHPELATALGPERFQREIKLAARLQHPHILSVHDSGEAAGQLWFTMPFVEGESLRDRLDREQQLPVADALRIARETALALEYAHQRGVIHRDIKPENLLLTTDGSTLVADFGIARAVGGGEQPLTGTGVAIGTPVYMSPEQASGMREVDARSDVYALGCVLFEMLAGEPPYTGPTAQAILARALTETPRPIHPMRAAVPEAVDLVIARAMAPTVADRYASAADFAQALEAAFTGAGREARDVNILRILTQRPLFAVLALGFLLGVGVLFAWRRSLGGGDAAGTKLVAVLPFENLGAPEDEYIPDGITDEVRGRLIALPGVQVIARGSSTPYKKTTKPPQEIAQELGVRYLLTATVRWEKAAAGARKLHVSAELVEVRSRGAPRIKWQHAFAAAVTADSLAGVFQIYADIGSRVAQALDVALGDSARQQLAERPTQNLAAYDAYLRGREFAPSPFSSDPTTLRRAAGYYAQAVVLDSTFAQAWAQLSVVHSFLYANSTPTPVEAEHGRRAAERARKLAPTRGETHLALGFYYVSVLKDNVRAAEEFRWGIRAAPTNADLFSAVGVVEQSLGQWDSALVHFQRAQRLDPRSVDPLRNLAYLLLWLRRYPQALESVDRALALAPANMDLIEVKVMISLAQGNLAGSRALIPAASKEVERAALVAFFAYYWDLQWVLQDADQTILLGTSPSSFYDDRGTWGNILAQIHWLRGDRSRARVYADSARIAYAEQLRAAPQDAQRHVLYGLSLAYLGRKAEAVLEGQRGVALMSIVDDPYQGPYIQHQLVRIYILVGEPEKALDQLEPLLKTPYFLSPGWLKVDPTFEPLRNNPRFQRLVAGGS
jgi:serine/threonine-protein kinase